MLEAVRRTARKGERTPDSKRRLGHMQLHVLRPNSERREPMEAAMGRGGAQRPRDPGRMAERGRGGERRCGRRGRSVGGGRRGSFLYSDECGTPLPGPLWGTGWQVGGLGMAAGD